MTTWRSGGLWALRPAGAPLAIAVFGLTAGLGLTGAWTLARAGAASTPASVPPSEPIGMNWQRNRLGEEKSPYLLQHKDNPVWWQAWGPEAFRVARERDVPIFLSIGYSTCHWCHVMEHESFERQDVADVLNAGFVAIKLDREERPDVDSTYMEAVQVMTGHGGWPMSVWLTPDGQPFFGGTYFPRDRFVALLGRITEAWTHHRDELYAHGRQLTEALAAGDAAERAGGITDTVFGAFLGVWRQRFDPTQGGFRGSPKFPQASDLRLLLRLARRGAPPEAQRFFRTTLDAMARGGIYDHLGGGFHRYSVDAEWGVPHFEKMLYDQAALASAYVEGYQATGEREYELVARETFDYVLRDLRHLGGAFYSAEDADSEGHEGKFYVFTPQDLAAALTPPEAALVAAAFGVTERGNFELGATVLRLSAGQSRAHRAPELAAALRKLLAVRGRRIRPHLDDKILTDWNGLMIAALARGGVALGEPRYMDAARGAAQFVLAHARTPDGALLHRWRDGEAKIGGLLDDYAFLIEALIELHQADFDPTWLRTALDLQQRQDALFGEPQRHDYFSSDGTDPHLPRRRVEAYDGVVPAGRSVAALNLLRLSALTLDDAFAARAARLFAATPKSIGQAPHAYSHLLLAADWALDRAKEVALVGTPDTPGMPQMLGALRRGFAPNRVLALGPGGKDAFPAILADRVTRDGRVTAYVCERHQCLQPTIDPAEAARQAGTFKAWAK